MKEDFLSYAAHEFRTPLTVLRGYAELLQSNPELAPEIAGRMIQGCERLERMIRALLLLTDLPKEVKWNSVLLSPILACCQKNLLERYPEVQLQIVEDSLGIRLFVDPDLLEIALMNLLENSVKYSDSPARITLIVKEDKEAIYLSVEDQGIGIASEHLPYVFNPFYSVDPIKCRKLGGVGLGLTIVRRIVEALRGRISFQSYPGKGSCATLILLRELPLQ